MDPCNIHEIKDVLSRHGFHFSKAKGQNFLTQSWVPERIAREAGVDRDCGVLEVGPGVGPADPVAVPPGRAGDGGGAGQAPPAGAG